MIVRYLDILGPGIDKKCYSEAPESGKILPVITKDIPDHSQTLPRTPPKLFQNVPRPLPDTSQDIWYQIHTCKVGTTPRIKENLHVMIWYQNPTCNTF